MRACRKKAMAEGTLVIDELEASKCFYMHTMDFTGKYLDYVVAADRQMSSSGESNVHIETKGDSQSQQWIYDGETHTIQSLYYKEKGLHKVLDYDPKKPHNLITSFYDADDDN